MNIRHLAGSFAIYRFPPDTPVPTSVLASEVFSVTRTATELSVVCRSAVALGPARPEHTEPDWSCLEVEGPLPFTMTGVLAELSAVLAREGVSLFTVSTHDTDYLFVKTAALEQAVQALTGAGHAIT
ncbi:MAG: amino acid-binding protein [Bacteroidetes bacterium CG12_big_fil_rev_8_21_14_0_65_60_17]|nr:MAG: amino acid-binding protein [Bacteroidetes bacterium CG12_big_fil_rev_8_21_14_0_65_60_17]